MEAVETKAQLLDSILTTLRQSSSNGPEYARHLARMTTSQGLLCASATAKHDTLATWAHAVSSWFRYLVDQLDHDQVSKVQAASHLLAVSLASCDIIRFLEQYTACTVKALQCSSKHPAHPYIWDIVIAIFSRITQLVAMPGLRREASGLIPKLMAAVQAKLTPVGEGKADSACQVEMLRALNAALTSVPTAFRSHQKALETLACTLLASPNLGAEQRREAAYCYAILPRVKGDAATWSTSMQRLLCSCHSTLDTAFLGMDDSSLATAGKAGLDPQAQPIRQTPNILHSKGNGPAHMQGGPGPKQSVHSAAAVQLALEDLTGLLESLERMLALSYPAAVPLPSQGILMLLTRILTMDDSARQAGQVPPSASAYLALLAALPSLHTCALHLLQSLLKAARGSFMPHFASCSHLLANLLRQIAAQPESDVAPVAANLRQQVYAAASELVTRGGLGVGALLGAEAVKCALQELYGSPSGKKRPAEQGLVNGQSGKKRKKQDAADLSQLGGMQANVGQAAASLPSHGSAPAQTGVLHLLESLLQSGSSSFSQQQRSQVDAIAVHMAATCTIAAERLSQSPDSSLSHTHQPDVQLAAMQTLLASVLSPLPHRPTFLPQALAIFCQGLHSSSRSVAAYSQQALLSMEGLIHPRAGTTVLQTDRSHPYHPATKQSEPSIDLGMPRLWSALVPESYVQQPPVTDSSVQPVESEAAASAAKEVLAAGQVYNEAMRQLETALRGKDSGRNGTGGASHVTKNAASAALEPLADRPVHVPDQTTCAEATSMKPLPIHVPYQAVEQPESIHRQVESHLTNRSAVQPHEPAQQQLEAADLKHNHVSTEQKVEDRMDDGFISLLPISGLASSMQVEHKLDQVVNMLADAESSDSQGELPDIDSGASDSDDDASE